jgi:hypothetical protein
MAEHVGMPAFDIEMMFTGQTGYATAKLGVHAAMFREDSPGRPAKRPAF